MASRSPPTTPARHVGGRNRQAERTAKLILTPSEMSGVQPMHPYGRVLSAQIIGVGKIGSGCEEQ